MFALYAGGWGSKMPPQKEQVGCMSSCASEPLARLLQGRGSANCRSWWALLAAAAAARPHTWRDRWSRSLRWFISQIPSCRALTQNYCLRKKIFWNKYFRKITNLTHNSLKMPFFPGHFDSRVQNDSQITKNNSQGIFFVIISCQRVFSKTPTGPLRPTGSQNPSGTKNKFQKARKPR